MIKHEYLPFFQFQLFNRRMWQINGRCHKTDMCILQLCCVICCLMQIIIIFPMLVTMCSPGGPVRLGPAGDCLVWPGARGASQKAGHWHRAVSRVSSVWERTGDRADTHPAYERQPGKVELHKSWVRHCNNSLTRGLQLTCAVINRPQWAAEHLHVLKTWIETPQDLDH